MRRRVAGVALGIAVTFAGSVEADVPASEAYVLHCAGCHGRDGSGHADFVPSLQEVGALLRWPGGRAYLARVPGVAQAPVSDAQLAALLNWLLVEISRTPDFAPYSATEVGALRRDPLRDPAAARPRAGQPERAPDAQAGSGAGDAGASLRSGRARFSSR